VEPQTLPAQPNNTFTQVIGVVPRAISYIYEKTIPVIIDKVKTKVGENRIYSNIADEFIDSSTTPINPGMDPDKEVTSMFR
jgi:hypothetical protein